MDAERTAGAQSPGYKWYVLLLLMLTATIYSLDRNVVTVLAEPIKREFGLSDSGLGLLTGAVFAISFTLAGLPMGLLIDRTVRKRLLAVLLSAWSGLTMLSGLAGSFTHLLLARIGIGMAESGAAPTSMSLLADYFPRNRRGTALGLFYLSAPFGVGLGFALGGIIAANYGWRAGFFVAGAPGLLLALIIILTMREPVRGTMDEAAHTVETRPSAGEVLRTVWARKTLLFLMLGATSVIIGQSGITAFFGPFLIRVHYLPIDEVGIIVGLAMGVGGAVGVPLGGVISDWLSSRREALGPWFAAGSLLVAGPCAVAALLAPIGWVAPLTFLFSAILHLYYGPTFSTYISVAPPRMRGAAGALLIVILNLVGYGLGPQIAGLLSDLMAQSGAETPLRDALVMMCGFFALAMLWFAAAGRSVSRDEAPHALNPAGHLANPSA